MTGAVTGAVTAMLCCSVMIDLSGHSGVREVNNTRVRVVSHNVILSLDQPHFEGGSCTDKVAVPARPLDANRGQLARPNYLPSSPN